MAVTKKRLGRGLGILIAKGGGSSSKTKITKKASKVSLKRAKKKVSNIKSVKKAIAKSKAKKKTTKTKASVKEASPFQEIAIDAIKGNPYQPRLEMNPAHVDELAKSIGKEGLLQPIVVRKSGEHYQLIAGERRWVACKRLNFKTIAASVIKANDASSAVISLIENLQRENLNPVDEAMGYASLMRDFDMTQEDVAKRVSKSRPSVANALRLLQLEQEIQGFISKSMLSLGHAKVILGLESSQQRLLLARRIIESGMSVREAERTVQNMKQSQIAKGMPRPLSNLQSAVIQDLQKQMTSHFNTSVKLQHKGKKGKIVIDYSNNDDLHRILRKMGFMSEAKSDPAISV